MTDNHNTRSRGALSQIFLSILSGRFGCAGTAVALVLFMVVVVMIIKAMVVIVKIGALVGLGITVRNYALALYHNVKREKVTP